MSRSSGELEKDVGNEKLSEHGGEEGLTHYQRDVREAVEPTFVAKEDDSPVDERDQDGDGHVGNELEQVASSRPSVNNIKSVPNGGLTAWLQVLMSFCIFMNTWGTVSPEPCQKSGTMWLIAFCVSRSIHSAPIKPTTRAASFPPHPHPTSPG